MIENADLFELFFDKKEKIKYTWISFIVLFTYEIKRNISWESI